MNTAVLRTKLDLATPALRATSALLWQPHRLRERYPEYLRAMHGVIRASVPLMATAARRCAELAADDPVARALGGYLPAHIAEELDHDRWLLEDLAALGADPEATARGVPPPAVARLVGPQYYWIAHVHPVALLGYIAVLEGNAPHPSLAGRIVAAAGVPEAAVRTVREHAELDTGHSAAIIGLLDRLPLTPRQSTVVTLSALSTVDTLTELLAGVVRHAPAHPTEGARP
ncbi:hypothetical protein Val02_47550 [Virgisporangium aliadipatigenens]|uniref:Iron-containing redox enzyme family protein n=1 Tax=Virgisporangium aliadipatigenens TaxID=741659 RepID=A0A8J3YLW0_9ACTN|nr:iron-containing redox enzyme family protein [Virgisporangium aliadipatigenens]GIJ47869.1 hypothetical protein Val02_47550 [Virgisporangium aliadipatigenens]